MRINLSASDIGELLGICAVVGGGCLAFITWYVKQIKKEIIAECKMYLYVIQERVQGTEIEINHINTHAEKAWPRFQRLILSIRRRDIDELR
jgi:hypothetical protein